MRTSVSARYAQARADHEYLWKEYAAADDMTGGYVDQEDLSRLMRSPTKATAVRVYESQIDYWFEKGPDMNERARRRLDERMRGDPRLEEIADRHFCEWPAEWLR